MDTYEFMKFCDSIVSANDVDRKNDVEKIKDALSAEELEMMSYQNVLKLQTGFIYHYAIDENANKYVPYLNIVNEVCSYFNGSTRCIASWSEPIWQDVISYIKTIIDLKDNYQLTLVPSYKRKTERAMAAKRLCGSGVSVKVQNSDLIFEHEDKVLTYIHKLVNSIGGKICLNLLANELEYIPKIGRFLVPHQGNIPVPEQIKLEIPYGFLYNLSLKYIGKESTSKNPMRDFEHLKSMAADFCLAIYDVQKFTIWEIIAKYSSDFIGVVREHILNYDIYTLPQTSVSFAAVWCKFICEEIKREEICTPSLKEMLKDYEHALNWSIRNSNKDKCVVISKKSQTSHLIYSMPPALYSHIVGFASDVNKDFFNPIDMEYVNAWRYPIYQTEKSYILLPSAFSIWNWYEALYNIVKDKSKNITSKIGIYIEKFIRNKMQSHGLITHTGSYEYDGVSGEIDILYEAEHGDIYIECKKKALSRNALKGDDNFIWGDLSEVIKSQKQCARTEYGVKSQGFLQLKSADSSYKYVWKDSYSTDTPDVDKSRCISKVTLTLKDYGPMQDNILMTEFMKTIITKSFSTRASAPEYSDREVEEFNKYIREINSDLEAIRGFYTEIKDCRPFRLCKFFNLEQLYFVIRMTKSPNDFYAFIAQDYVSLGTLNFWNEFVVKHSLNMIK